MSIHSLFSSVHAKSPPCPSPFDDGHIAAYRVRPKQSSSGGGGGDVETVGRRNFARVAEQQRDSAGDEAMFVPQQPSNENYQGRPLSGCG